MEMDCVSAIVLGCVLGITGVPQSKQELMANWAQRIRLGPDLKGGSHMVLQVQVQDAFKADADQVIEQLKPILARQSVAYGSMDRNDPRSIETGETIQVDIRGAPSNSSGAMTRAVNEAVGDKWTLAPVTATGYKLILQREAAAALRQETLVRTISRRSCSAETGSARKISSAARARLNRSASFSMPP
jgi:preprotein translocase subunit SecD